MKRLIWSLVLALAVLIVLAMIFTPTPPAPEWWRHYLPSFPWAAVAS